MIDSIMGLLPYIGRQGLEYGMIISDNEGTHFELERWKKSIFYSIYLVERLYRYYFYHDEE